MSITIKEITERVRFLKKEKKETGEGNPILEYLIETPNAVGTTLKIDEDRNLTVLAANVPEWNGSFLMGYIPEGYSINEDDFTKFLLILSEGKITEKSTIVIHGENEPTKVATRIDQEMLENIDEWFSTMILVCGLPILESFSQSWEN